MSDSSLLPATTKQLLSILADGKFHSGTELAHAIGLSRSAVWKHLQTLNTWGLTLNAVSGKGYKLQKPMQLLDQNQIEQFLSPESHTLLKALKIHDHLTSTNSYLLEAAQQGAEAGWVCAAEYQSAGRGRRGRHWISPFGHNIYLSLLWRYQDSPAVLSGLSLVVGLGVVRALTELGLTEVGLKWPNDIYVRQRKLAGILVEVSGESGGPCHAVVGVGINFHLPEAEAALVDQPWIDISSLLGESAFKHRNQLVGTLINHLLPLLSSYGSGSINLYADEWRRHDCMLGKQVNLTSGNQSILGRIAGIDDNGLLLLDIGNQQIKTFASGEISFKTT